MSTARIGIRSRVAVHPSAQNPTALRACVEQAPPAHYFPSAVRFLESAGETARAPQATGTSPHLAPRRCAIGLAAVVADRPTPFELHPLAQRFAAHSWPTARRRRLDEHHGRC